MALVKKITVFIYEEMLLDFIPIMLLAFCFIGAMEHYNLSWWESILLFVCYSLCKIVQWMRKERKDG